MSDDAQFSLFIGDLITLYDRAAGVVDRQPAWVARTCRRAIAVLKAYRPEDVGQEILIETAIEGYEALLKRAGRT